MILMMIMVVVAGWNTEAIDLKAVMFNAIQFYKFSSKFCGDYFARWWWNTEAIDLQWCWMQFSFTNFHQIFAVIILRGGGGTQKPAIDL